MSFAWEDHAKLSPADIALLREAEQAAKQCTLCYHYGHRWENCPSLRVEVPMPPPSRQYMYEVDNFYVWVSIFWLIFGAVAGVAGILLWQGLNK